MRSFPVIAVATFTTFAMITTILPVSAATFTSTTTPDGRPAIAMDGQILKGDEFRFSKAWSETPDAQAVILSSPGGLILPALAIGETIHRSGMATMIAPGQECASACADIWLAAPHRILLPGAKVGFHGIYGNNGNTLEMTGAGNGLVGAYLGRLGYSDATVILATAATPTEMVWLTSDNPWNQAGLTFETTIPRNLREQTISMYGQEWPAAKAPIR